MEKGKGDPVLLLTGETTWSYLYRRMIPALSAIGRVLAPDLIGFGRSDKPILPNAYTYKSHVRWLRAFIRALDLERITLVCQDWGGLLGLRVLAETPDRFARVVAMNTVLPDGRPPADAFLQVPRSAMRKAALAVPALDPPRLPRDLGRGDRAVGSVDGSGLACRG